MQSVGKGKNIAGREICILVKTDLGMDPYV